MIGAILVYLFGLAYFMGGWSGDSYTRWRALWLLGWPAGALMECVRLMHTVIIGPDPVKRAEYERAERDAEER